MSRPSGRVEADGRDQMPRGEVGSEATWPIRLAVSEPASDGEDTCGSERGGSMALSLFDKTFLSVRLREW